MWTRDSVEAGFRARRRGAYDREPFKECAADGVRKAGLYRLSCGKCSLESGGRAKAQSILLTAGSDKKAKQNVRETFVRKLNRS